MYTNLCACVRVGVGVRVLCATHPNSVTTKTPQKFDMVNFAWLLIIEQTLL